MRMVQFSPLEDNRNKKTDSNDLSNILNSHSIGTKHTDAQTDHQWQRNFKPSEDLIPFSRPVTHDLCHSCLDNFPIPFECLKAQGNEVQPSSKLDTDIENKVSSDHVLTTSKNLSLINKDCALDHPSNYISSSEIEHITPEECQCSHGRHPESFKVLNKGRENLPIWNGPNLCPNKATSPEIKTNDKVNVKNAVDIELENAGVNVSLQNKAIEEYATLMITAVDFKKHESRTCTMADIGITENIILSEATESNIIEAVPTAQVMISGFELPLTPQTTRHSTQKKSMPPNVSQSFSKFAHKGNNQYNIKSKRTNPGLKAKVCTKMSQDFMIQHQNNKIKSPNSHCLDLSHEAGISTKFQHGHVQWEIYHINQRRPKSPKPVLSSVSKHSSNSGEPIAPFTVRQGRSSVCSMDLKYSDMFKEINSTEQGPGIYEMFGTPVYSREQEGHENEYCRNVHSAPVGNATQRISNHFKGKRHSGLRRVQKKTHPMTLKNSPGVKQKKKESGAKETSALEGTCTENGEEKDGPVTLSSAERQMKSEGSTAPLREVVDKQALVSSEFTQPTKQNEFVPNSNLSPIEEVSQEHASDADDAFINKAVASNVQEILWPEVKVHAEYAPFTTKSTNEHTNVGLLELKANKLWCYKNQEENPSALSFPEGMSSPSPQNLQHRNVSSKWHLADSVSQTYQDVLSNEGSEEITEDLFCYSVAKLLSFEHADGSVSRTVTKNAAVETSNGKHESTDDLAVNVTKSKNFSLNGLESGGGNRCLDVGAFLENSLTNEDPILWTKGEILGKGAYGTVYCGLTSQGHLIAVKQVALNTSDQAGNEKEYQKLQEEVEILKNLSHINIVGYLGTGLEENLVSIFMEFVPGGSISSIIHRFGPLPETVFCKYTKQIAQGVAYLHENCVIHRDIKGNNVMLMPNGIIKLIDFGCAKRLACVSLTNTHSEPLKSVHGTPYWMAPEVINESGYGRKSDVWSIGCTVFEMATGKPPLASMGRIAAMFYIGAHRGLMPSLPKHCSKKATEFVHLCLTRDQFERPSALQLLQHPFLKRS
uniref:Mitogen-activated protein kinase kinase kinase 19 n=1 Tax=Pogona vitticeps TaxID=103695 RepID=A0A6J0SJS2_9SAUR